jgi:4,5-dihydroxyphthalate decarboxylase
MHVVVVRREIYEQNKWVIQALFKAFVEAKAQAMRRLRTYPPLPVTLPWMTDELERTQELMGEDYWSYGLEQNRHVLEAAALYAWQQRMLEKAIDRIDDLFAPEGRAGVLNLPT